MSFDEDAPTRNERPRRDSGSQAAVVLPVDLVERLYNGVLLSEQTQRKLYELLSEPRQVISVVPPPPQHRGVLYYVNVAVAAAIGTALVLVACR